MEEKALNDRKSEFYVTYSMALTFRYNLDLAKGNNTDAIAANIYVGKCKQEFADSNKAKETILEEASKYYVTALRLARTLKQDQLAVCAIELLKNIGRDENGVRVLNDAPISSEVAKHAI